MNTTQTLLNPTLHSPEVRDFEAAVRQRVVGQDRAVNSLARAYQVYLAGLAAPGRPLVNLLLALAMVVYARRVLLEARGRLKVKRKQPKAKRQAKAKTKSERKQKTQAEPAARQEKTAGDRKVKIDPPRHQGGKRQKADKQPAASVAAPAAASSQGDVELAPADEFGPAEGSDDWLELSKSARRRVKKLRRRKAAA